jgi:hypothetical protein
MNAQVPGNVPTNDLEGWWSFDGNGNDLSGNGNDFTNNGATLTTDRNGNSNAAYDYNGTNQYMVVNSPSFSFAQTDSFTVSFWMEKTVSEYGIAVMQSSNTSGNFIWIFQTNLTGNLSFGAGKQQSGWSWAHHNPYALNTWEHYLATYANGTMKLYKDGSLITTSNFTYTGSNQAALPLRIGRSHAGNYFDGKIDDLGIWSRVLTQSEINALYLGCNAQVTTQPSDYSLMAGGSAEFGIEGNKAGLTYQWQSDSAGTFQDLSGSNYQGVNSDTLTINVAGMEYSGVNFRCVVAEGTDCFDTSMTAKLNVCGTLATQPQSQTVAVNANVEFFVTSNDPNASYQWQIQNGSSYVDLINNNYYSGTNSDTLRLSPATMLFNGKVYRCVFNSSTCSDTSNSATLTVADNIGLNEFNTNNFKVYPIPAKNFLSIESHEMHLNEDFKIVSSTGQIFLSGKIDKVKMQIDISNAPAGTYFFMLEKGSYQKLTIVK